MESFNRNDPRYWKWGLFYHNPDDPEILIDKREGAGLTFNFAHKKSYILLAFLLLFPVLVVALPIYWLVPFN